MKRWITTAALAAASVIGACAVVPAQATELVVNGDFSNGLTGWTDFQSTNGVESIAAVSYDVTGSGSSAALRMYNIGKTGGNVPGGGGVFQVISLAATSDVTFTADFAAVYDAGAAGNASGGIFSLFIDGVLTTIGPPAIIDGGLVASFDKGFIRYQEIYRGSLKYQGTLAAGSHRIGLLTTRDYGFTTEMSHYYDNVSFDARAQTIETPEPGTLALLSLGLVGLGVRRRKKAA